MRSKASGLTTALAVAIVIFIIAIILPKFLISDTVTAILSTQGLELVLALLAIFILGKGKFGEYGFRAPRPAQGVSGIWGHWVLSGLAALAAGAVATMIIAFAGASGNPIMKSLSIPQMILIVWVFSSTIEEVFTRGFLQSHLAKAIDSGKSIPLLRVDIPTLISAVFFACMHLSLLFIGADYTTIIVILLFTFSVGLLAGHQRSRTGSLYPAIGIHMLANIGGVIGGVIFGIYTILTGGKLPGM